MAVAIERYADLLSPEFQTLLLGRLARDRDFLARARPIVFPRYFNALSHAAVVEALFEFWDRQHELPSVAVWIIAATKVGTSLGVHPDQIRHAIEDVTALTDAELPRDFLAEQTTWFAQRVEGALAVAGAYETIQTFDIDQLALELRKIIAIPARFTDPGLSLREQWATTLPFDANTLFPTGWKTLDNAMRGGLHAGELWSVMAPMKRFKTGMLINIALRMMQHGQRILYYSLEMYPRDIVRRMLSILSGIPTNALPHEPTADLQKAMDLLHEYTNGSIVVKDLPAGEATVGDVEAHLAQIEQQTGLRHVVVLDYADLLRSEEKKAEEWTSLQLISRQVRVLGKRHDIPVLTASQTNATGFTAAHLGPQHQSGSTRKAFEVDWMWALEQTEKDYELNRFVLAMPIGRHDRKFVKTFWFVRYETGRIEEVTSERYMARAA